MRTPPNPEREAILEQSVLEAWTLQATGERLGITGERVRQLLKKRGLDKLRVKSKHNGVKERPVHFCQECGAVILNNRTVYCSEPCSTVRRRRWSATHNKAKYHADPAFREHKAQYQREHPEVGAAASARFRQRWGGATG